MDLVTAAKTTYVLIILQKKEICVVGCSLTQT